MRSSQGGAKFGKKGKKNYFSINFFKILKFFVTQKFSRGFAAGRDHSDIEMCVGVCNDRT